MTMWWQIPLSVASGVTLLWLLLLVVFWRASRRHDDPARLRDALRLVPDTLRLVRRLAADPTLPRGVRVRLTLLAVYLVSPIDLVPDVIPIIGLADDIVLVALVLRSVVRRAGPDALDRHWAGTDQGLHALKQLVKIT